MSDVLRIKRRALGGAAGAPGSLAVGELAFNEVDGGLYIGRSNSTVVQVNGGGGAGLSISDTPPASPTNGQLWWESDTGILWLWYTDPNTSQWVAISSVPAATAVVSLGGQLTYVSATALKFAPYQGNYIRLNSVYRSISAAGIAGLANTGVYVNGTAGQNLAASTTYWIFAFDNAGTLTADFRTSATHITSTGPGNEGVEILFGDETRSLIGMCRTNASSQFQVDSQNIGVLSWFNRRSKGGTGAFTTTRSLNSLPSWTEINTEIRVNFLCWADTVIFGAIGSTYGNTLANGTTQLGLDGVQVGGQWLITFPAANYVLPFGGATASIPSEGWHYLTLGGFQGTVIQQWYGAANDLTIRCSISVNLQG